MNPVLRQEESNAMEKPISILFVAASPQDMLALQSDAEFREIQELIRRSGLTEERVKLLPPELATSPSQLVEALLSNDPDIIHFSAHGDKAGALLLQSSQTGQAVEVPTEALEVLFRERRGRVRCVVFNACWSEKQAKALSQYVPCVVGMTRAISDGVALQFAQGFYRALIYGRSIQSALMLGRLNITVAEQEREIPQLIARDRAAADRPLIVPDRSITERAEDLGLLAGRLPTQESMQEFVAQMFPSSSKLADFERRYYPEQQHAPQVPLARRIEALLSTHRTSTILLEILRSTGSDSELRESFMIHQQLLRFVTQSDYEAQRKREQQQKQSQLRIRRTIQATLGSVGAISFVCMLGMFLTDSSGNRKLPEPYDDGASHPFEAKYKKKLEGWHAKQQLLNDFYIRNVNIRSSAEQRKLTLLIDFNWEKCERQTTVDQHTWLSRSYNGQFLVEGKYSQLQDGMPANLELALVDYSFSVVRPVLARMVGFLDFPEAVRQQDRVLMRSIMECLSSPEEVCTYTQQVVCPE